MYETQFVLLPLRPCPVTKGLGVLAGITAISFAAAWAFEQHRQRELARILASMPRVACIFTMRHGPQRKCPGSSAQAFH
ncbi:hypothetical protein [Paraburkholderia sacchari]|uniref:hypothetical protein n=1 Tax=Paraburkholderia sacchari TaxID=159450 RepID=UPI001BD07A4A|nr:hypothetical protein [Paraburkholderia sacchari]